MASDPRRPGFFKKPLLLFEVLMGILGKTIEKIKVKGVQL